MSKKRTKGFTIKRATYMAQTLRECYGSACSVEVVIWAWIVKKRKEIRFNIYIPGGLLSFSSWSELEDKFANLISKPFGRKGE